MTIAVTSDVSAWRSDNTAAYPLITPSGYGTYARWKVADQLYTKVLGSLYQAWKNRTQNMDVHLRDVAKGSWTLSGVTETGTAEYGVFTASSGGFNGAVASDVTSGNCSIEGKINAISTSGGLYLQSGSAVYTFINSSPNDPEHAMVFHGDKQTITIWELGVLKGSWKRVAGELGLVELYNGVVSYYVIRSGVPYLLRRTRSKLSYPVKPTVFVYEGGAHMDDVTLFTGSEATTSFTTYGVLTSTFQDLQNQMSIETQAEQTTNKDKTKDFTYFGMKRNLRMLSLNLEWRLKTDYDAFREFFDWHDVIEPFIFVDSARETLTINPSMVAGFSSLKTNEMFVKFISAFKDNPLGADLYGVAVDIQEEMETPVILASA